MAHINVLNFVAILIAAGRGLIVPEQVRLLNPIDGSQTEHRLLVTTRIRDLVPKATRVELPLMGKDEAVALLLELANVEEAAGTSNKTSGGATSGRRSPR